MPKKVVENKDLNIFMDWCSPCVVEGGSRHFKPLHTACSCVMLRAPILSLNTLYEHDHMSSATPTPAISTPYFFIPSQLQKTLP